MSWGSSTSSDLDGSEISAGSDRFRFAEVLFLVNTGAAIGADISRIFENSVDLGISFAVLQLTGMQGAVFLGVDAVFFRHDMTPFFLLKGYRGVVFGQ
jgi:hypothetical protein